MSFKKQWWKLVVEWLQEPVLRLLVLLTMAIATTFGTTSTGTAISTLSGAATNRH